MDGQRTTGEQIGEAPIRSIAGLSGPAIPSEQGADGREGLIETLGELLSATHDEVDHLLDSLRDDLPEAAGADSPDAFERGLELGLLVGLGSREAALQVIADD
ncbi:MAG: hypothetical protein ACRDLL_01325 [Solirubrobacterales bacterium]